MGLVVLLVQEVRPERLERVEMLALLAAVVLLGAVVRRVIAAPRVVPVQPLERQVVVEVLVWLVAEHRAQIQVVLQCSQPVERVANQRQGLREVVRIRKAERAEPQEPLRHLLPPLLLLKTEAVGAA